MIKLTKNQMDALNKIKNGSILCGTTGSGKSLTALGYFYLRSGGPRSSLDSGQYTYLKDPPKDLYIITTARKRDTLEWEEELCKFLFTTTDYQAIYDHKIMIDSWNNIKKYVDVEDSFFIFDEQRVIGYGAWTKSFLKIAKNNEWILLSATPGDIWLDYAPVFIANGFYKNKTDFLESHVVWQRGVTYPKIKIYINEGRLLKLRQAILIEMPDDRKTIQHHEYIMCDYDRKTYLRVYKDRWNIFDEEPITNASQWCYLQRKVANLHESREMAFLELLEDHEKAIVFYNFDYELWRIRSIIPVEVCVGEWNGHRHDNIPDSERWVFLVQYTAGSEGWNCIRTDCIIFWSENYSYRMMVQAAGRIDRLNTPFKDLWYYHFRTQAPIDLMIESALKRKKDFNIKRFSSRTFPK